jgi:O-antigen/teichoic acid export membrane protein
MTMAKRTIAAAAWSVGGRLLSRSVDLVTLFVLARLLSPADFGVVAIAMILISIVESVFELPLAQALMRLETIGQAHLDTAFTLAMTRALVLSGLISLMSWPFALVYGDMRLIPLVCLLSLAPAMRGLTSPGLVERLKHLDFVPSFKMELAGKLFGCAAAAVLGFLHLGYWALVANTVVGPLVMALLSYYLAPYRPRLSFKEWRSFSDFLGWASAAQLLGALNWQCDRLVLGRLLSRHDVGLFSMASDVAGIPTQSIVNPIISPIMAAFSNLTGERHRLVEGYKRASAAITFLGTPLLVGLALNAYPLVALALGPQWAGAAPLLQAFALQAVLSLLTAPLAPLVMSLGRTDLLLRQNILEASVKIPLVILGALVLGINGVVAARFVAAIVTTVSAMVIVRGIINVSIADQLKVHWRQALSVLLLAAASLLCTSFGAIQAHGTVQILVSATVGGVVYVVSALAFGIEFRTYVPARFAGLFDRSWRTMLTRSNLDAPHV